MRSLHRLGLLLVAGVFIALPTSARADDGGAGHGWGWGHDKGKDEDKGKGGHGDHEGDDGDGKHRIGAPEIDPSGIGAMATIIFGGVALTIARRKPAAE